MTVRLYLFAEGQTEQIFARTILAPHLATFRVSLQAAILIANARRRGIVYRGGGRHYLPMKNDIVRFLRQESGAEVFFTTMIDLYAIHSDFPGLADAERFRNSPSMRVECLEQAFAQDVNDRRFIPHIQLHEFEAYLFSKPEAFEFHYPNARREIAALKAIADRQPPELIDDGQHTAPSKRIGKQFPDYEDSKTVVAATLAERIGLELIRQKCHHFNSWLSRLEALAET